MRSHCLKLLFLTLLLFAGTASAAGLEVRVTRGLGDAQPIAIVPFEYTGEGEMPVDVSAVVANDLERSGRFKPLPPEDMLEQPSAASEVNFQNWRVLGMDYVVVGKVMPRDDGYVVQFQLLDVYGGRQLLGYSIPIAGDYLRRGAHKVSDLIYEELTGTPGAFSTRIAFVLAVKDGDATRYQLVVADADGANQRPILRSSQPIMSPSWSPDGRRIAYVSFENNTAEIFVQELMSGEREAVSSRPGINGAPSFSPSGEYLAMTLSSEPGNPDIWVKSLESGELRRITSSPAIDTEAVWAPDGSALYFTSDRGGGPQIYRAELDARGDRPARVTFEGNYNARPIVSPNGELLGMVHQDSTGFHIAVVDLERKTLQVLTEGRQDESPSFAPNGAMIIYATQEGNKGVLAASSVDGRVQQRLAVQEGDVREPAWSPFPAEE
ncbi:MAG TPA: Tol-Pal system beta propeller repeat protein TolB [Gammaproteobacteria bacterium]